MKLRIVKLMHTVFLIACLLETVSSAADSAWALRLEINLPVEGTALAYSLDAGSLLVGHSDGTVSVWNSKTGILIHTVKAHSASVKSVACLTHHDQLLTVGSDGNGTLWSTADWTRQGQFEGIAFLQGISRDGQWFVAQDPMTNSKWLWNVSKQQKMQKLEKPTVGNNVNPGSAAVTYYVDGGRAYFIDNDQKTTGEVVAPLSAQGRTGINIETQKQGTAVISLDGMQDDDAPVYRISVAPTSATVAVSRRWMEGFVDIWRLDTKQRLARLKPDRADSQYKIFNTTFSFDGSLLAMDGKGNVSVWDLAKGEQLCRVKGTGPLDFSPKSHEFALIDQRVLRVYSRK